jgi:nitroimidazol reductase NimA-like FMN-containing flavoprotein (pyridoxamine 5'-phosphate oxidase superfamily)
MPGYGIADAKAGQGLLPWKWARERLENGHTYFIATTDPAGKPHLMPVWGVWFDDAFFFSTGRASRKARNLAGNAQCSIATEIDFARRPKKKNDIKDSVIIEGLAEIINDLRVRKKFGRIYQKKYDWDMEGFEEPIYRVCPSVAFGLTTEFTESATRWTF